MDDVTDQRSRDLECDRQLSAGLCMAAAALAASRHFPRIAAVAGLFEPRGAGPALAPIIVLSGILGVSMTLMLASDAKRRAAAAACIAFGALAAAFTVPFLHQGLVLFFPGISPSKAGAIVAFAVFGIVTAFAADGQRPSPRHLVFSSGITVFALFMAAVDADGIFACILAVMGFCFFSFWRQRPV
ncbi:MAG TPA: hypothetical protein VL426_00625 [Candidatus Binatia bacterium]|nr:hypothetical protein [Candidatus Binatia bacterium]